MKRSIALFVLVAMLMTCCVFPVFAQNEQTAVEPVVLIEDDMITGKGTTKNHLSAGTTWNEQDQMLESGADSYIVYKLTVPATEGAKFRIDFKNKGEGQNGAVHRYSDLPKYACYVTDDEPAADFDGDVTGWNTVAVNEKISPETYSYTYSVDSALGYEEAETIYICFKFAPNDTKYEGQDGWNDSAWIEKITATTVPYEGILVYDGSDNSGWETGILDNETPRENDETTPAVCYDFSLPAGNIGSGDITAIYNLDAAGKSFDISEMDFIVFDIYVTDKLLVSTIEFCLELSSAGMKDVDEHEYAGYFGGMGDGWNTVKVRLDSFQIEDMDKTNFNYFCLSNNSPFEAKNDFAFKIDNIRFEKAPKIQSDYDGPLEEHLFYVLDGESELDYMINCTAQNSGTAFRFCDTTSEIVYKFTVVNRYGANKVLFTAMFSQQLLLQVSQDGATWQTVYKYEYDPSGVPHQGLERAVMEFDLTSYVDLLKSPDIYIRIADANTSNGWGGTIHSDVPTTLAVQYTEMSPDEWDEFEKAPDERSISLLTCSTPFGSFIVDTWEKTAGFASLMLSATENNINDITFDAVDATGYDALEFDLYVANTALMKVEFTDTGIELSSAGGGDNGELSWTFADLLASHKLQSGWNHITLLFRDGKPSDSNKVDFDPSAINYFRIYFLGVPEKYQGATFGIDNVRLTKAAAELDAEQARLDQEEANDVIEKIDQIGEVTTKSSSKINRAKRAYDKLTDAQKALVTNYATLEAAIAKYEELTKPTTPDDDQKPGDNEQNPGGTTQTPGGNTQQKDDGCGSVMTLGAASVMLLCAAWVTIAARKKED